AGRHRPPGVPAAGRQRAAAGHPVNVECRRRTEESVDNNAPGLVPGVNLLDRNSPMRPLVRGGGRLRRVVLATWLGAWGVATSFGRAEGGPAGAGLCPTCHTPPTGHPKHHGPAYGTLGYGKPGLYPGFQGFGLGYHPGYGYGGAALGVGADGGYPFYG